MPTTPVDSTFQRALASLIGATRSLNFMNEALLGPHEWMSEKERIAAAKLIKLCQELGDDYEPEYFAKTY